MSDDDDPILGLMTLVVTDHDLKNNEQNVNLLSCHLKQGRGWDDPDPEYQNMIQKKCQYN